MCVCAYQNDVQSWAKERNRARHQPAHASLCRKYAHWIRKMVSMFDICAENWNGCWNVSSFAETNKSGII